MKAYDEKHIKNVAIIGSAKSGKTTLAETMLFEAGLVKKRGSVEEKNTISDYHEIEKERGSSVYSTALHTEWRDYKINLIDTPGIDDFIGEVIAAVRVCDTAIMVLNAQHGVEAGSEVVWDYVDAYARPTIFCVNQLDHQLANFNSTVEQARQKFGSAVTIMQYPINAGNGFNSIIDLLKMTMYSFPAGGGKPEKHPIPASEAERAKQLHIALVEKAAENDEALMELYFEKGKLDEDELRKGLKAGMMGHVVFPVFCLSAKNNMGTGRLMGFIDNVAPSAMEMPPEKTEDGKNVINDITHPSVLFVYKTLVEPHLGKLSFFKVLAGELQAGAELYNQTTGAVDKITQLFIMDGKNKNPIDKLKAGDIGSTLKLKNTFTNQTLCAKGASYKVSPIDFPESRVRTAIVAKNKVDDEKLSEVLHEITVEDPTLLIEFSRELKQVILHAQGELHLAVTKWRLEHVYKMQVEFIKPKISFRETIQKPALASYRHKKQSGGAGQFGEVYIKIEPWYEGMPDIIEYPLREKEEHALPWGGKLIFNNCITGGAIDSRFLPSILKGVMEKMQEGPLTGSHVRDVRVTVYDGKMHAVDSNDISFKIAGMMAFKDAFHQAQPQLLEPVYNIEVEMPDEMMGDVMSDLQTRRSIITGMDAHHGRQVIKARTPLLELDGYSTALKSMTRGKGKIKISFADYAPVPGDIQKKLHEEYGKKEAEEHG